MPKQTRERMIDGALKLLAEKGLQRASFHEVTQATSTPRGSIYYHFPGGKSEMVAEALAKDLRLVAAAVAEMPAQTPREFADHLFDYWRSFLLVHDCTVGCAAAAVVIAAEDETQMNAARTTLAGFVSSAKERLVGLGVAEDVADTQARALVAALEGGVLLARAEGEPQSLEAARQVILSSIGA